MTSRELGDIFRDAREKRGMTIEDVSQSTCIHLAVIRDIENGVFDRLGPIYTKSFVKKYAVFLELDLADILSKYDAVIKPEEEPKKVDRVERPDIEKLVEEKTLFRKPSKEMPSLSASDAHEKRSRLIMIFTIAIGTILFILMFTFSIRFKMFRVRANLSKHVEVAPKMIARQDKNVSRKKEEKKISRGTVITPKVDPAPILKPAPESQPVKVEKKEESVLPFGLGRSKESVDNKQLILTLKARGLVWIQVFKGDRTVFVGTLKAGESRTLNADNDLTVWTGKGENLDFNINGRDLGKAADGVVRDIEVSRGGIKINNKWVKRVD